MVMDEEVAYCCGVSIRNAMKFNVLRCNHCFMLNNSLQKCFLSTCQHIQLSMVVFNAVGGAGKHEVAIG